VATPILRSAGGGQLQVQRPALTSLIHHRHNEKQTQLEEKQQVAAVTPQQQHRVQNTSVSMEDGKCYIVWLRIALLFERRTHNTTIVNF
jgi:hypothetical protein